MDSWMDVEGCMRVRIRSWLLYGIADPLRGPLSSSWDCVSSLAITCLISGAYPDTVSLYGL
jgi:hypothetical protein